ncbi:MAG TPA: sugar phosphorylase [Anaerolineaceae bacterium]|jgi:sucrose phosphorylase
MTLPDASRVLLPYLVELYGPQQARATLKQLSPLLDAYRGRLETGERRPAGSLTHRDALLITYPDQVTQAGQAPLATLAEFAEEHLAERISAVHLLPFYPSSSDDGFAVIDYREVDRELGGWEDVSRLAGRFRLMADGVINHVSSRSPWLLEYLAGDPHYHDYFIDVPPDADLSKVVRPRTTPLVTPFPSAAGEKHLWTTFSADQVDLDYHHPQVLLDVLDALLLYVSRGAQLIRLDAIAYLWKEYGTSCIHLPQTHTVIRFLRAVFDLVAPSVLLVTETNVPHVENLSYFGSGHDEAQMIYNFALPPLVVHTFLTGMADKLTEWAAGLALPSRQVTFLNFLASHDGIGVNPVKGILNQSEVDALVAVIRRRGGLVSSKSGPGGVESPYELNISYFDAISDPQARERQSMQVERFLASQAIMLALLGMPGIYFHSLLGSRSWMEGVQLSGRNRSINRQKFDRVRLEAELANPDTLRAQVFERYARLLAARQSAPAFDPFGQQTVLQMGSGVFGLLRGSPASEQAVLCLTNVSDLPQTVELNMEGLGFAPRMWSDLIGGQTFVLGKHPNLLLQPYQVLWLA